MGWHTNASPRGVFTTDLRLAALASGFARPFAIVRKIAGIGFARLLFRLAVIRGSPALPRLTTLVFLAAMLTAAALPAALLAASGFRPVATLLLAAFGFRPLPTLLLALTLRILIVCVSIDLCAFVGITVRHEMISCSVLIARLVNRAGVG
jgi:hypothetical protein